LLLPGGQGLDAVGFYDGSRAHGLRIVPLTPIQIQKALQKKERENRDVRDGRSGGYQISRVRKFRHFPFGA